MFILSIFYIPCTNYIHHEVSCSQRVYALQNLLIANSLHYSSQCASVSRSTETDASPFILGFWKTQKLIFQTLHSFTIKIYMMTRMIYRIHNLEKIVENGAFAHKEQMFQFQQCFHMSEATCTGHGHGHLLRKAMKGTWLSSYYISDLPHLAGIEGKLPVKYKENICLYRIFKK